MTRAGVAATLEGVEPDATRRGLVHMGDRTRAYPRRLAAVALLTALAVATSAGAAAGRGGWGAPPSIRPGVPRAAIGDAALAFEGGVSRIGPFLERRLTGRNWHPGCPVGIDDLRHVHVRYRDFTGRARTGPLIVHETVATDVLGVFRRLYRAGFRIHRIKLPPSYRPPRPGDYWHSTRNRTAALNCRPATGNPGSLSHHSYGWAIEINPLQNPYVSSSGAVLRRAAKPYVDRSLREPGMIRPGDVVVRAFARIGWEWGGNWVTLKDYMHFSLTGR